MIAGDRAPRPPRGRITAKAIRPIATQTASRRRLTRLKEIAVVGDSPSVSNVATKPPSSTPRLAGTRNVATLTPVLNASITVAVASDTSVPRNLRSSHVSTEPRSQADEVEPDREAEPPGGGPIELPERVVDAPEHGLTLAGRSAEALEHPAGPAEHAAHLDQDEQASGRPPRCARNQTMP